MSMYGIVVKSPWAAGRWGQRSGQDWYRQCVIATRWADPQKDVIAVYSANMLPGTSTPEVDLYQQAVKEIDGRDVDVAARGTETVSHICALAEHAHELQTDLVLVTTWTHWLRVRYIAHRYGIRARFLTAWGLPRPRELVTDAFLAILYPLICMLGRERAFLDGLEQRRQSGKF